MLSNSTHPRVHCNHPSSIRATNLVMPSFLRRHSIIQEPTSSPKVAQSRLPQSFYHSQALTPSLLVPSRRKRTKRSKGLRVAMPKKSKLVWRSVRINNELQHRNAATSSHIDDRSTYPPTSCQALRGVDGFAELSMSGHGASPLPAIPHLKMKSHHHPASSRRFRKAMVSP
jgi:hypothetical protein